MFDDGQSDCHEDLPVCGGDGAADCDRQLLLEHNSVGGAWHVRRLQHNELE